MKAVPSSKMLVSTYKNMTSQPRILQLSSSAPREPQISNVGDFFLIKYHKSSAVLGMLGKTITYQCLKPSGLNLGYMIYIINVLHV
jgi:hypothetical protein